MSKVSIRKGARALGIAHSTLSRQVRDGAIPSRNGKVSVREAKAARAANIDPRQQRPAPDQTLYGIRCSHEATKATKAEFELAVMRGEMLSRADLEDRLFTAGREFRDGALRRWRKLAPELVGLSVDEIEAKITASNEALLTEFERKLQLNVGARS